MRSDTSATHLSAEQLAAYLDGRLTGSERERVVRHFAVCGRCREELTERRELLTGARPRYRHWVAAAAVAAAILLVVAIPRMTGSVAEEEAGRVRAEPGRLPSGGNLIAVVSPVDQAPVPEGAVKLSWRSAGEGATYSITVQDSSSNEVWKRTSMTDTSVTMPDSIVQRGRYYFWSVDARLGDGNTAGTGAYRFIVR